MPYSLILCNTASKEEAHTIARHLVENRLAACVNIIENAGSVYLWEDQLCEEKEFQLLIKSKTNLYPEIESAILSLHSYKVPEIICLPMEKGLTSYFSWIDANTI